MKKILLIVLLAMVLTACGPAEVANVPAPVAVVEPGITEAELDAAVADAVEAAVAPLKESLADAESAAEEALTRADAAESALADAEEAADNAVTNPVSDSPKCEFGVQRVVPLVPGDPGRVYPILQQKVIGGEPQFNNDKMVLKYMDAGRIDGFYAGDIVCVGEHYLVSGGYNVFTVLSGFHQNDAEDENGYFGPDGTWTAWDDTAEFNVFIQLTEAVCDSRYPGVCIPISATDLDCPDISFTYFEVESDPHGFDADNDGIACEVD